MYKDLNDYEMIYLVSEKSDFDFNIMLEKYNGLIYKIINKYKNVMKKYGYDQDDLYQICSYVLYNSVRNYDSYSYDNLFYTYINKSLINALNNILRTSNNNKNKVLNESISYDNIIPNTNLLYVDILPDIKADFGKRDFLEFEHKYINFRNSFEFDTTCILDLKVEGFSLKEISSLLEVSYTNVSNKIRNIKKHL